MQKIFFFVILIYITGICHAQKMIKSFENDSCLIINKDSRLDDLMKRQKQENLEKQSMPGYRVQIYFGGNRQKASEIKMEFNNQHPEVAAYLSYQQPNYKVRVGDFRSRFDARKIFLELEGKYPTTFIVPDEVRLPPLK